MSDAFGGSFGDSFGSSFGGGSGVGSTSGGGGKSRRSFVEIDGELIEVSGYREAEKLLTQLRREEKAQDQDRKKQRIILGKIEERRLGGVLYGRLPQQQAKIENRMDERAERIQKLYTLILKNLEEFNEEEEILLLQ